MRGFPRSYQAVQRLFLVLCSEDHIVLHRSGLHSKQETVSLSAILFFQPNTAIVRIGYKGEEQGQDFRVKILLLPDFYDLVTELHRSNPSARKMLCFQKTKTPLAAISCAERSNSLPFVLHLLTSFFGDYLINTPWALV